VARAVAVTVLFTDLIGSTELSTRVGAAKADELRVIHFELLRDALAAQDGREVKSLGDGIMAVFAGTSAALDAAVAMQQRFELHNRSSDGDDLLIRIGVATGDCTEDDGDYFGEPVVIASRLCSKAVASQILAPDVVRLLAPRGSHELIPVGDLDLKGIPEAVATVEVVWHPLETESPAIIALPDRLAVSYPFEFVGRSTERAALRVAWKSAEEGERRIVLLSGEAGLGKTRLSTEVAREAFANGALVLYGRCDEEVPTPYRPWVEALEHYVARASDEALARLDARALREASVLVPALGDRLPEGTVLARDPGDLDQYVLFAAVTSILTALATEQPVLIVMDDLHWADRGTLLLLRHVANQTYAARILIIATYRETDIGVDDPLTAALASLHRETGIERMSLLGLSDDEVLEFLEATAGHEMDADGVGLAHALRLETAGNPFFVGEMLRHLAETQQIVQRDDGRWIPAVDLEEVGLPESVRAVVGARVRRLGEEALRVLGAAAVVGREFDATLVAVVVDVDFEVVCDILENAITAGIVDEVANASDRYTFTHALVQQTLYDDLPASRRVRWHRTVAESIEALADDVSDRAGELARHWFAATRPAEIDKAIAYAIVAGDQAVTASAPEDAMGWYRHALDAIGDRADEQRCGVMVRLGDAERQAGDPAFRQRLLDAAELAQQFDATDLLVDAALANFRGYANAGQIDVERVAVLEAALQAVNEDDLAVRARLLATLAVELQYGEGRRDVELVRESIRIARLTGDSEVVLDTILRASAALALPGLIDEWDRLTREAVMLAEGRDDPRRQRSLAVRFNCLLYLGNMSDLRACHRERDAIVERLGHRSLRYSTAVDGALIAVMTGDIAESERLAEQQLALGTETGQPDTLVYYGSLLLSIRFFQGRESENVPLLIQTIEGNPGIPAYRAVLAQMSALCGDLATSRTEFDALAQDGFAFPDDLTWLIANACAAEAAVLLRDTAAARLLFDRLEPYETLIAASGAASLGAVSHYLGLLAAVLGRPDQAERYFTDALKRHERLEAPFFKARTLLELALLAEANQPRHASDLLDEAMELAARYDMARVQAQVNAARERTLQRP
jgi:class 3 adenylate cyclase